MIELLLEAERALSYGLTDRAEQLYRQVATGDPKNSIAIVGLARVALERADDLGAYLLARRALAVDPENEAARRLAVRLEEVLATRGEPVADPMPAELAAPREGARVGAAGAGADPGGTTTPAAAPVAPATDDDAPATAASSPFGGDGDASAYQPPRPAPDATSRRPARRSLLDRLRRR